MYAGEIASPMYLSRSSLSSAADSLNRKGDFLRKTRNRDTEIGKPKLNEMGALNMK